jgi:hypothetical protein
VAGCDADGELDGGVGVGVDAVAVADVDVDADDAGDAERRRNEEAAAAAAAVVETAAVVVAGMDDGLALQLHVTEARNGHANGRRLRAVAHQTDCMPSAWLKKCRRIDLLDDKRRPSLLSRQTEMSQMEGFQNMRGVPNDLLASTCERWHASHG